MFGGFAVSTQDPATHYRSGDVVHLETTLEQYLPLSKQTLIGVSANAFYYEQVTGDSGSGAILGGLESTDIGVGPVVTLIHMAEKYNFSFQAKWLPEIYTKNRLSGDRVWVVAGVQFRTPFCNHAVRFNDGDIRGPIHENQRMATGFWSLVVSSYM